MTKTEPVQVRASSSSSILILVAIAQLMVVLDTSIVNVALPTIQDALRFGEGELEWLISAYTLTFGGLLLLGGRLGDLFGRRRLFLFGVALFALASLAGGFADRAPWLLVARALQGVGAAAVAPTGLALLADSFGEGRSRSRAIGIYAAVSGAASAIGVLGGGVLTDLFGWRAVMFVNVPIGVFLLAMGTRVLPVPTRSRGAVDLPGALSATGGIGLIVAAMLQSQTLGWTHPVTIGCLVGAAGLLIIFVLIERRAARPLVPLPIFASRTRSGAYLIMLLTGACMFTMFFFLTQYLQSLLGYGPLAAGLAFLPMSVVVAGAAIVASRVVMPRAGTRLLLLAGTVLLTVGLGWLSRLDAEAGYAFGILPGLLVAGLGLGCLFPALNTNAVSGVAPHQAGLASGLINTSQQIGGTIGIAVLSTVAAGAADRGPAAGWATGFLVATGLAAACFVIAVASAPPSIDPDDRP